MDHVLVSDLSFRGSESGSGHGPLWGVPVDGLEHGMCIMKLGCTVNIFAQFLKAFGFGTSGLLLLQSLQSGSVAPMEPCLKTSSVGTANMLVLESTDASTMVPLVCNDVTKRAIVHIPSRSPMFGKKCLKLVSNNRMNLGNWSVWGLYIHWLLCCMMYRLLEL